MDDPNQGKTHFRYSAFGELVSETDANGQRITYRLDTLGRVTARNANGVSATFTWDTLKKGLLSAQSQGQHSKTYTYDEAARVVTSTTRIDGKDYTVTTAYDGHNK